MTTPEARNVYQRLRQKFGGFRGADKEAPGGSEPFGSFRDPGSMADAFDELSSSMGWAPSLARADLGEHWADIVGDDVAAHAHPTGFHEGALEIQCDSSAWATQLASDEKDPPRGTRGAVPRCRRVGDRRKSTGCPLLETWRRALFQGVVRAILTGRNP